MKIVCIVLRNIFSSLSTLEYAPVVDAFMEGGFPVDKVIILPFNSVSVLCETIGAERGETENFLFVCDPMLLPNLKSVLKKYLDKDFTGEYTLHTEKNEFFLCPTGKEGVQIATGELLPLFVKRYGNTIGKFTFRLVGAPMKKIRAALADIADLSRNTLGFHLSERFGDIKLQVTFDESTPAILVDSAKRILRENLGEYIYAEEDIPLEKRFVEELKERNLTVSVAESFTGGGVGERIVRVSGASEVYFEGLNTYSDESKKRRLGVTKETLSELGAVSDQTAYEMATGLLMVENCDVAISTTGIAGPNSDGTNKPVGLCYIGIGYHDRIFIYKFNLSGDREKITQTAINYALFRALKAIQENN